MATLDKMKKLLAGAYDMHTHPGPDLVPRSFDVFQLAEQCRALGMAGYVAKIHNVDTSSLAWAVNREFKDVQAIGAICLNYSVGGLCPMAINTAAKMGAKMVWFPTVSSIESIERGQGPAIHREMAKASGMTKGIKILQSTGKIVPEAEACLHAIAENKLILSTGHLTIEETTGVVDAAISMGIKKIIACHPRFPLENQLELAKKGCLIEQTRSFYGPPDTEAERAAGDLSSFGINNIKKIGAERMILSTDSGMLREGKPQTELADWNLIIPKLLNNGITESQIVTMVKTNPKKLVS